MRLAWWKRKQRRVPAKALVGIPAPEYETGAGIGNTLRYAEQFSTKAIEKIPVLDDCPCCHFAAAVQCEAENFCVGFTQKPLRPPDCGSKMTAGTIGDGFERTQFYNSRGRDPNFVHVKACSAFSLTPMKRRVLSWQGKRERGFSTSPCAIRRTSSPPPSGGILPPRGAVPPSPRKGRIPLAPSGGIPPPLRGKFFYLRLSTHVAANPPSSSTLMAKYRMSSMA